MKISISQLQKLHACTEAIEMFQKLYGDFHDFDMSLKGQLQFLKESPLKQYWAWAIQHQLIPAWSMRKANLQGADLRKADLQEADLRGADLRGADLQEADLRGADLRGADLRGADLRGADLRKADLQEADLQEANLWGADLWGALGVPNENNS